MKVNIVLIILFTLLPALLLTTQFWLQGRWDAITYSRKGDLSFSWNEHRIPVQMRIIWLLMIIAGTILGICNFQADNWVFLCFADFFTLAVYSVLGYSFWHNAAYGITKSQIFKTQLSFRKGFTYVSPADTAKYKQDFKSRLYTLLFSFIILAVSILIKYTELAK